MRYFECHITIEPIFGKELEEFKEICKPFNFKVANLLMQKDREATPERSDKDTFCTGHDKDYDNIHKRMMGLVKATQAAKFKVWRYKIEDVLLDVKLNRHKVFED